MLRQRGNAYRNREIQHVLTITNLQLFRHDADFLRPLPNIRQRGFGKNQQKFLAAVPARDVFSADMAQQQAAEFFQHHVPGFMGIGVVQAFKVVNIDHHDAQRRVMTLRPPGFPR